MFYLWIMILYSLDCRRTWLHIHMCECLRKYWLILLAPYLRAFSALIAFQILLSSKKASLSLCHIHCLDLFILIHKRIIGRLSFLMFLRFSWLLRVSKSLYCILLILSKTFLHLALHSLRILLNQLIIKDIFDLLFLERSLNCMNWYLILILQ